jgi:hypothetical protein
MHDDDELVAEAAGGGNKLPPPVEVICGDDPERRENRAERFRRLQRQLEEAQRKALRADHDHLHRRVREIHERNR